MTMTWEEFRDDKQFRDSRLETCACCKTILYPGEEFPVEWLEDEQYKEIFGDDAEYPVLCCDCALYCDASWGAEEGEVERPCNSRRHEQPAPVPANQGVMAL